MDLARGLLSVAALLYLAGLLTETLFNLIVLQAKEREDAREPGKLWNRQDWSRLLEGSLPPFRQAPWARAALEKGGAFLFALVGLLGLASLYLKTRSYSWLLAGLVGLVLLYTITNVLSLLLARLLMAEVSSGDEDPGPPED